MQSCLQLVLFDFTIIAGNYFPALFCNKVVFGAMLTLCNYISLFIWKLQRSRTQKWIHLMLGGSFVVPMLRRFGSVQNLNVMFYLPDSVGFSKKLGLFNLVPFSVEIFAVQRLMLL